MEIKRKFLEKYLHNIAIEQLSSEYLEKGYQVSKEQKIGKYQADIIAKKGDEILVIEVKSARMTPDKKENIKHLADYIRSQGNYKFLIAVATPPKEKKLEIINIEQLLELHLMCELPDELDELSTHTRIEEVTDVDIDEINIEGQQIYVKGDGLVTVNLQVGSDSDVANDDGFEGKDSFPFEFEITLEYDDNKTLEITNVDKIEVDTSSFYE